MAVVFQRVESEPARAAFTDSVGQRCEISDWRPHTSPVPMIWLGVKDDWHGNFVNVCMGLDQAQAAALLPLLRRFIETGSIKEEG